jgi:hypothetical protein
MISVGLIYDFFLSSGRLYSWVCSSKEFLISRCGWNVQKKREKDEGKSKNNEVQGCKVSVLNYVAVFEIKQVFN